MLFACIRNYFIKHESESSSVVLKTTLSPMLTISPSIDDVALYSENSISKYSRVVMQQCTCYFFHFAFYIYAFISTTSTVSILCTCPIMYDKVITYCCLHY